VIVGFFINDAEPDPALPRNPLVWRSSLVGLLSTRFRQGSETRLRDYRDYYHWLYRDGRPGWERLKASLREFGALLRADGTPATLILLPELHEPRDFGGFADVYAKVGAVARASGFEVLDPSHRFPTGSGPEYWVTPGDAHPNRAAQRIFAETLLTSKYALPKAATP